MLGRIVYNIDYAIYLRMRTIYLHINMNDNIVFILLSSTKYHKRFQKFAFKMSEVPKNRCEIYVRHLFILRNPSF